MADPDDLHELTPLLNRLDSSREAEERVFELVYAELRRIAHRLVSRESGEGARQATELLHETYLKKLRGLRTPIRNRQHFYSLATRAMRHVLIERCAPPEGGEAGAAGRGRLDTQRRRGVSGSGADSRDRAAARTAAGDRLPRGFGRRSALLSGLLTRRDRRYSGRVGSQRPR